LPDVQALVSNAYHAYSQGDLPAAERLLSTALQHSSNHVEANVLLGIVCARKGNREAAAGYLQKALSINPAGYEAHVALSTVLFASGQADKAIEHGRRAIALQPSDPESYHHLARDLIAHGSTEEAIPYLRQALQLAPTKPFLIQDLAAALTEIGQLRESQELWQKLTLLHPRFITGWIKLGGMHLAGRNFAEAVNCGLKAASLDPNSADAHVLAGLAYLGSNDAKAAEVHLSRAIELEPNDMVVHSANGLALHVMGRFEEARPYFEKALEFRPTHGQSYYSLILTRKTTEKDRPLLEKLSLHLEDRNASVLDRSYMHYALGKANEDLGDFEASMSHYDEATNLAAQVWFSQRPPDRSHYSEVIQATIETFTPTLLRSTERQALRSEKPLLVVGMIRSGTTLVEQILSSHPKIKGAGELTYWHEKAAQVFDYKTRKIDELALRDLGEGYLELLDRLGPGYDRVVDKMPHNYTMLGLVLAAIPAARVIYVKRRAIDNCLSIYTTAYQHPPAFTLSRSNIVFGYREHERIMAHWKSVLPSSQLLEVKYEDLIEKPGEVIRQMIDFTGLEWDDACLHHEQNENSVNTPSVWQVRQPIYKNSVERWRRFEPWIKPFDSLQEG
jgi:tetratricopeptide (TPR) repeat protein